MHNALMWWPFMTCDAALCYLDHSGKYWWRCINVNMHSMLANNIMGYPLWLYMYLWQCCNSGTIVCSKVSVANPVMHQISHNTPFSKTDAHACAYFCYKIVHCEIWEWYNRNTAWLRDTVRQGSQRPAVRGPPRPLTSRGTSARPYRVTTQYSFYPVQLYS